ncbi:hypothetical protein [Candidatus Rhodobacter oscarellae]|uniref:hypothetical protein n=1 Tax=Candidatus Rhodobacter oscarellae TaxID=1675527 RepID=UPI00128F056F|nr:hypothetical protein [Candidatus Rhodobacter lobularis]
MNFLYIGLLYLALMVGLAVGLVWASGQEDPEIRRSAVNVFLDMLKVSFGAFSTLLGAVVVILTGVKNDK